MSVNATIKLCVLWEHELRAASKLLAAAYAMPDETDEQRAALVIAQERAYHACEAALHGLADDYHPVLLAAATLASSRAETPTT